MVDPLRTFTAIVVGVAGIIMLAVAVMAFVRSRRLGDDILRSRMYLRSHLLRRGYFLFIVVSAGMFLLGIPISLGLDIPAVYYPIVAVFVMVTLDVAIVYFYFLAVPPETPVSAPLRRLSGLLGGLGKHDDRRNAR